MLTLLPMKEKTSHSKNNSETTNVNWLNINGKDCIYFHNSKILSNEWVPKMIAKGEELAMSSKNDKHTLVLNCLKTKNYEVEARDMIQKSLNKNKDKIEAIYVITESPVIFAAIEIVSFFTSYNKIKAVASIEELHSKINL